MIDRARIHVEAGAGGDGCLSFRREAHVPRGGPDGGDGGRGGDVEVVCDASLRDLQPFRRRAHFRAPGGANGRGAQRHGADGEVLAVPVPPGTEVIAEDGTRWDLVTPGQRAVVARGGSGGRGNKRFAGPTRQTPRFAERGLPGEEAWLTLRLKLLADAGLVGLPNAGKSSLLSRLTRAAPKVADYPFTTLEPVLGTLELDDRQLVLADIPGLIEGASQGSGLGHDFLAHVERTQQLVHVVDLAPVDGADPERSFDTVERELARHDPRLASLPRVVALSKADLVTAGEARAAGERWRARLGDGTPVVVTSSATGEGLDALAAELARRIPVLAQPPAHPVDAEQALPEHRTFRPGGPKGFAVSRAGERSFRVTGPQVERIVARYDLGNQEALAHLEGRLRRIGVIDALEAAGFTAGDDVEIAGTVFDLDPALPP